MIKEEIYNINNIIEKVENVLNSLINGRQSDMLDPTQAISLGVLLQTKAMKNASIIRNKYIELGNRRKEYLEEYNKTRQELSNTYDLYKLNEKKVERMCLEENEQLSEIQKKIIDLEADIKGLKEETKYIGYLSKSWESIIDTIKYEWKEAGR